MLLGWDKNMEKKCMVRNRRGLTARQCIRCLILRILRARLLGESSTGEQSARGDSEMAHKGGAFNIG